MYYINKRYYMKEGIKLIFKDLETDRLYLKSISMEDKEFLFKQFTDNDVNEYLYDCEPMKDISEAVDLVNFYTVNVPKGHHRWILVRKEDGVKMGTCGFHCFDEGQFKIDVGYDMQKAYWGKGYMTEAVTEALKFIKATNEVHTVDAHIYIGNEHSMALAKRLGFEVSGKTVNYNFRGVDYLHNIYTLTL